MFEPPHVTLTTIVIKLKISASLISKNNLSLSAGDWQEQTLMNEPCSLQKSAHSGANKKVQISPTHHGDSRSLPGGPATEPPPGQSATGKTRKRTRKTPSQVEVRAVGTGSSGWGRPTGSSGRGSERSWSCCCCACCPFRSRSETPPSPCTEAGRGRRPPVSCGPTGKAPRTG